MNTKTRTKIFGLFFILISAAYILFALIPTALAEAPADEKAFVAQRPQEEGDAVADVVPGSENYDNVPEQNDAASDTVPGILTNQEQQRSQSAILWVLVAIGFGIVAVLITISIVRTRRARTPR